MLSRFRPAFLLLLLVAITGCGSFTDKFKEARPKTVPAQGTVTLIGSPVGGATVVLAPVDGKYGAAGMADSSGNVVFRTFPPDDGVVPGKYKVSVSLMENITLPVLPPGVHADDVKMPKPKSLIPPKFTDPNTSGLTLEVPSEGSTELKIEMKP